MKRRLFIPAAPAIIGASVRIHGSQRATTTDQNPHRSQNSRARDRFARLRMRPSLRARIRTPVRRPSRYPTWFPPTAAAAATNASSHALSSWSWAASTTPAANSSESPGRNSPMMNAHSRNTKDSTTIHTVVGAAWCRTPEACTIAEVCPDSGDQGAGEPASNEPARPVVVASKVFTMLPIRSTAAARADSAEPGVLPGLGGFPAGAPLPPGLEVLDHQGDQRDRHHADQHQLDVV